MAALNLKCLFLGHKWHYPKRDFRRCVRCGESGPCIPGIGDGTYVLSGDVQRGWDIYEASGW